MNQLLNWMLARWGRKEALLRVSVVVAFLLGIVIVGAILDLAVFKILFVGITLLLIVGMIAMMIYLVLDEVIQDPRKVRSDGYDPYQRWAEDHLDDTQPIEPIGDDDDFTF